MTHFRQHGGAHSWPEVLSHRRPECGQWATSMAVAAPSLRGRSLPELREMLRRQEKLLGDRKFISKLPDRGKKISDLVEKLKIAIAEKAELNRTTELLSSVRREFQKKQEAIESRKQNNFASNSSVQENPALVESPAVNISRERPEEAFEVSSVTAGNKNVTEIPITRTSGDAQRQLGVFNVGEAVTVATDSNEELSEAFGRISIGGRMHEEEFGKGENARSKTNPFQKGPKMAPKTPHYIEVLEMRAKNPMSKRSKFKTNMLASETHSSSCGSPEISSPGGPPSSITAEERCRRDRKDLDDVTAARVPPLHHEPTKLLAIEESITIQVQQKLAYEEMQAKLAAQKLAEKLNIKMDRYEPEGEMATGYKEVKDEEDYSSAED